MPGLLIKRHVLSNAALSVNQQMGGNPQSGDIGKVRMAVRIKAIAEQLINMTTAKLTRREAYIVNHQQAYFAFWRPGTLVGRRDLTRRKQHVALNIAWGLQTGFLP